MDCREFRALWEAEMDEDPEINRQMTEHLGTCTACAEWLENLSENDPMVQLLRRMWPRLFRKPNDPSTS